MLVCSLLWQERGSRRTGRGGQREENRDRHSFLHQVVTLFASLSLYFYFVHGKCFLIIMFFPSSFQPHHRCLLLLCEERPLDDTGLCSGSDGKGDLLGFGQYGHQRSSGLKF